MTRSPTKTRFARTLRKDAIEVARRCFGWQIRATARRIERFFDERLAPNGLTLAQFDLMAQVAAAPDDRLSALAQRLDIDASTLSRNLRLLEASGWVEVAQSGPDLRRRMAWLTEAGVRRLEAAMPAWRQAQTELEGVITLQGIQALADATASLGGQDDANRNDRTQNLV